VLGAGSPAGALGGGDGGRQARLVRRAGHRRAGRVDGIHVTAVDVDPEMVDAIRRRLEPFGDRADSQVADASLAFWV